jgi:hypothetical protein
MLKRPAGKCRTIEISTKNFRNTYTIRMASMFEITNRQYEK